jgi:hypothetical protein
MNAKSGVYQDVQKLSIFKSVDSFLKILSGTTSMEVSCGTVRSMRNATLEEVQASLQRRNTQPVLDYLRRYDKMYWNYRVVLKEYACGTLEYGVREVHYDENDEPVMCTQDTVGILGDSLQEIKDTLENIKEALDKPVLNYDDIGCQQLESGV